MPLVQKALAELENDLFSRRLERSPRGGEVFVTGLPRAGTTLLLEMLYRTGEFASFTYRHMPFILSPLLFGRTSRKAPVDHPLERAHGDGMTVSLDSPEAFEEVIWLAYLRDLIVKERILSPLTPDMISPAFESAFRATIRKLLAERGDDGARYLSKNNANISRIDVLSELFPDATIVVAFREPGAHVASLMRQHRRFSHAHADDPFARRYMAWIGHFEFGLNFRPINFGGWLDGREIDGLPTADFWMRYWTAAYRHALEHATANVLFVDFDRMLAEGATYLAAIGRSLRLRHTASLIEQAATLRAPTTPDARSEAVSAETLKTARAVHADLRGVAAARIADDRDFRKVGTATRNAMSAAPPTE